MAEGRGQLARALLVDGKIARVAGKAMAEKEKSIAWRRGAEKERTAGETRLQAPGRGWGPRFPLKRLRHE